MYNNPKTTNLKMSYIILILPLNQLLRRIPAKIVDIPIHSSVIVPDAKFPNSDLFVIIDAIPFCDSRIDGGIWEIPFNIDAKIINVPAKYENILMNPEGVGLENETIALSMSKALRINAKPSMLKPKANASLENPNIMESPLVINRAPGKPKKNFE
jgi:hypothetical protein